MWKMPSCFASIHCKSSCARRSKYSLFSMPCLLPVRPGPSVDEQHFDIGCIAEFAAAEFACAQNGGRAGFLVGQARCAIELGQLGLAVDEASLHNHLGQLRDGEREVREARRRLQNVLHVDAEEFLVLEAIEGLFARRIGLDLGDDAVQLLSQGDLGLDEWGVPIIFQQRQEIHVLPPEKVFPQKIAGAEESSQERVGLLVVDKVPGLFLPRMAGLLHDQIQEPIEGFQGFGRVRGPGQGVGELLDQHGRQPHVLLVRRIGQFISVPVPHVEAVVQLRSVILELRLADIDVAHGQGVGKGIQKGRGILGADVHDRIGLRPAVVERDLNGMQEAAEGTAALTELLDKPAVDLLPGLLEAIVVQEGNDAFELRIQPF